MSIAEQILPWQRRYWALLAAYIEQRRIPQALLITGNRGIGKQRLATGFAQALLCDNPDKNQIHCGRCHACALFHAGTHPDFLFLRPEESGKSISIDQIRGLTDALSLTPQYDRNRVVIVCPAEQLNKAAANAFLKCLEEPAERTVIILVTERPTLLPATIRSRCQKLAIKQPASKVAIDWLRCQNFEDDARQLLDLAQGAPLLAQQYAEQQMLTLRNNCFNAWIKVAKKQINPLRVAEEWQNHAIEQLFQWLISWVMDLVKFCYQKQMVGCYNTDLKQPLQALAQGLELKKLFAFYDLLLVSRRRSVSQLNKQILIEEILINWSQLNNER